MHIQGIQKLTLLDYPNRVAATLFAYGCNLRCPFCHNASLVINKPRESLNREELDSFLTKRKGVLEGICLSGGEPLMNPDCLEFLEFLKSFGYKIKLDTNGFFPERLKAIAENGLVDHVALDIKASKENYAFAAGVPEIDIAPLCESVEFLMNSGLEYEFRTTAVKGIHGVEDFYGISQWISGAKAYYIQQFSNPGDIIGKDLCPFSKEELELFLNIAKQNIPNSFLRGI